MDEHQDTLEQIAVVKQIENADFYPHVAFTLTLRKCPFNNKVNLADNEQTKKQFSYIEGMCRGFNCRLNQLCFGRKWFNKYQRDRKSVVQIFISIEVKDGRFHLHGSAELPRITNDNKKCFGDFYKFCQAINGCWANLKYGGKYHNCFKPITTNDNWTSYCAKDFHKHDGQGYCSYSNFSA